jgi:hypothetical protein
MNFEIQTRPYGKGFQYRVRSAMPGSLCAMFFVCGAGGRWTTIELEIDTSSDPHWLFEATAFEVMQVGMTSLRFTKAAINEEAVVQNAAGGHMRAAATMALSAAIGTSAMGFGTDPLASSGAVVSHHSEWMSVPSAQEALPGIPYQASL